MTDQTVKLLDMMALFIYKLPESSFKHFIVYSLTRDCYVPRTISTRIVLNRELRDRFNKFEFEDKLHFHDFTQKENNQ